MCPRFRSAAILAAAVITGGAGAHAPLATRTLRLQLEQGRLEGLLTDHLPAAGAQVYAAAEDPALALVPRAVAGLQIDADGARLQPKVTDARTRKQPDGAIEAVLLLD